MPSDGPVLRAYPRLRAFAAELLATGTEIVQGSEHRVDDDVAFMCATFLCKQLGHMGTLLLLENRRDVVLIARSMQEGLWQLLWAVNGRPDRPRQWRAFSAVENWRRLQRNLARGTTVDPTTRQKIEVQIAEFGSQFLRPKNHKGHLPLIGEVPDPYYSTWRKGVKLQHIAEQVQAGRTYSRTYHDFSDWHHWGVAGLQDALRADGQLVQYVDISFDRAVLALAVGFGALHQTCELMDAHLELGRTGELKQTQEKYLEWHKTQDFDLS
jgi:hypothetical protein